MGTEQTAKDKSDSIRGAFVTSPRLPAIRQEENNTVTAINIALELRSMVRELREQPPEEGPE